MAVVINTVFDFVTSYWLVILGVAGGLLVLHLVRKGLSALSRSHRPIPSRPGVPLSRDAGGAMSLQGFGGRSAGRTETDDTSSDRGRYQSIINDLREDNEELKDRVRQLTRINGVLAPLIKELNSNVDRRRMGPIVVRVLERLFEPTQALVFLMERDGETLTLVGQHGADLANEGFQQRVGEGFAGIVAKKRVLLSRDDLESESNLVRQKLRSCDPGEFDADIATPILYRGNCLGVICMGGVDAEDEASRHLFGMVADMTSLSLTNSMQYRQIQELANSDPLTRIYNKGYFLELCEHELAAAEREQRPMSILMIDLDHFKNYNDTNGHLAGDRLLKELADLLKTMVREQDIVGRFGGEEFIVLLHGIRDEEAVQAAERIRQAIEEQTFAHRESQPLGKITTSVGVASLPTHGKDAVDLIGKADDALYAAKKAGRNRVGSAGAKVEVISF